MKRHVAITKGPQDGESLVTEALEMQKPLAAEKGIGFMRETRAGGVRLLCDMERVILVFSSLLGIALKFCGSGDSISILAEPEGELVRFSIRDTGPGITEEDLPRLLQPYWTTDGRSRAKGAGFGLFITKGIVQAHGGGI